MPTIAKTMTTVQRSLCAPFELRPRHEVPRPARFAAVSVIAVALALGLMSLVEIIGEVDYPNWWWASLLPNIAICLCIVHTLAAVMRLGGRWLPAPLVARMADVRDIRAGMALSALALSGIVLGMTIGFTIVPWLLDFKLAGMFISLPAAMTKFAVFLLFVLGLNWAWWRSRLRRRELQHEAVEARLRLLQGQMEPHLLFNTLANVQSLMDYDPPRAKQMLETFSDYLRAGLTQLRQTDSTVQAELDLVRSYLSLMQIRMDERLRFRIEADLDARAAHMPALMLQPLVENAIHHGLEPKLDGGTVVISAEVRGGRLTVRVGDDGVGLDAPRRRLRPGAGIALSNLRTRLQSRFGSDASLAVRPAPGGDGVEAILDLPYRTGAGTGERQ